MTAPDLLRQAIAAARGGQPAQARLWLRQVVATRPSTAVAWLWLSEVETSPEAQLAALERAAELLPANPAVQDRLAALRQAHQRAAQVEAARRVQAHYQQAVDARRAHRPTEALQLLLDVVRADERCEPAWWLLSELAPELDDKIVALENVLTLNPTHTLAQTRLAELRVAQQNPVLQAARFEARGQLEQAASVYLRVSSQARTAAEREEADRRLATVQHRLEFPKYRHVSPSLELLRLTLGPPVLFGLIVLVQSGLNPLHVSPLYCVSSVGLLLGAWCTVAAAQRPRHPAWLSILGEPGGRADRLARWGLYLLGSLLLLGPWGVFLVDAGARLRAVLFRGP